MKISKDIYLLRAKTSYYYYHELVLFQRESLYKYLLRNDNSRQIFWDNHILL